MQKPKILAGIITGTNPPRHLLIAYGRHIFRLFHVAGYATKHKGGLWMRDIPLSICELASEWRRTEAYDAYWAECNYFGIPSSERIR